jgi:hypothetical protein
MMLYGFCLGILATLIALGIFAMCSVRASNRPDPTDRAGV